MNVIIIEDEFPSYKKLDKILSELDPSISVVAHIESVEQLRTWFSKNEDPDLIFSDIELADGQVFQVYDHYTPSCPIIFTSAHDNFFSNAFKTNGIEYLLKPYDKSRVKQALAKFHALRDRMSNSTPATNPSSSEREYRQRFTIKRHKGIELIDSDDIALFQLDFSGLLAYDCQGRYYPLHDFALNMIEEQLDPKRFFRLNRNQIINIRAIELISPYGKDKLQIKLANLEFECITSSHRTPVFRKWIDS